MQQLPPPEQHCKCHARESLQAFSLWHYLLFLSLWLDNALKLLLNYSLNLLHRSYYRFLTFTVSLIHTFYLKWHWADFINLSILHLIFIDKESYLRGLWLSSLNWLRFQNSSAIWELMLLAPHFSSKGSLISSHQASFCSWSLSLDSLSFILKACL